MSPAFRRSDPVGRGRQAASSFSGHRRAHRSIEEHDDRTLLVANRRCTERPDRLRLRANGQPFLLGHPDENYRVEFPEGLDDPGRTVTRSLLGLDVVSRIELVSLV